MPSNEHFSWLAPVYDWFVVHRDHETLRSLLDLRTGQRILDVGGGTGSVHDGLGVTELDVRPVVFDRTHEMLSEGKSRRPYAVYVRGDAREIPFMERRFDRVLLTDALHHMDEPERILRELKDVMKPDGVLVIEEFNPSTILGWIIECTEWLTGMGSHFYTPPDLLELLQKSDFSEIQVVRDGFIYYTTARCSDSSVVS